MSTNNSNEPTNWLPPYKHVPILEVDHCAELIKMAEASGLSPAGYLQHDGSSVLMPEQRRSHAGFFGPGHPVYEQITDRIVDRLDAINHNYDFELYKKREELLANIHVLRYDGSERGHLTWHADTTGYLSNTERKLSLSILLNAPWSYAGGRLNIFNGQVVDIQSDGAVGTGIVFPSFQYHQVTPVESGVRYVAVAFLKGPKFR